MRYGAMPVGAKRKEEVERTDVGCMVGKDGLDKDSRHGPIARSECMGLGSSWRVAMKDIGTGHHEDSSRDPMSAGTGIAAGKGGSSCDIAELDVSRAKKDRRCWSSLTSVALVWV